MITLTQLRISKQFADLGVPTPNLDALIARANAVFAVDSDEEFVTRLDEFTASLSTGEGIALALATQSGAIEPYETD